MPFHLRSRIPPPSFGLRLRRFLRTLLGGSVLLTGLALLALGLTGLITVASLAGVEIFQESWREESDFRQGVFRLIAFSLAGIVAALLVIRAGFRVIQGPRRLVLFLRRFGFEGAYKTLSFAVGTALGRSMRLVTLDDGHAPSVGVPAGIRKRYGVSRWVGLGLGVAGVVLLWFVLSRWLPGMWEDVSYDKYYDAAMQKHGEGGDASRPVSFLAAFQAGFTGLIAGAGVLMLSVVVVFFSVLFTGLAGSGSVFSLTSSWAIGQAEHLRHLRIAPPDDVHLSLDLLVKRMQRIFAPRLVVLKVADELWREVVRQLFARSHLVLIDITYPSEHLLWEIRTLREQGNRSWLLIGLEEKVRPLAEGDPATLTPEERELQQLIREEDVLVYAGLEEAQMRQFSAGLRNYLQRER